MHSMLADDYDVIVRVLWHCLAMHAMMCLISLSPVTPLKLTVVAVVATIVTFRLRFE